MPNYQSDKQILFGDFNGDGKLDLTIPVGNGTQDDPNKFNWTMLFSNQNPNGGMFFKVENYLITDYWPVSKGDTDIDINNYFAMDVNKDGKTDIVKIWSKSYRPSPFWEPNNFDSIWKIYVTINNLGKVGGSGFVSGYSSSDDHWDQYKEDFPIVIPTNIRYQNQNKDLVILRETNHDLTYVQFNKDVAKDNRLTKVTSSGGNIVNTIKYLPMVDNNSGFYYSLQAPDLANYPLVAVNRLENNYLVSQLSNTVENVTKFQDFKYAGYVVGLGGIGEYGFTKTARSNWYLSDGDKNKLWSGQSTSAELRGAITDLWTTNDQNNALFAQPNSNGLISYTSNRYVSAVNINNTAYGNGLFNIMLQSQTKKDYINNFKTVITNGYTNNVDDFTGYGLQSSTQTENYYDNQLQGTTITTNSFEHNPSGIGNQYYIGRPTKTVNKDILDINTNTFTTELLFTSYDTAGNLLQTKKRANNASYYIVEDMEYTIYGNLKKKTISAPAAVAPENVQPRVTFNVTYDPTYRYIASSKDIEGLLSEFTYHPIYGTVVTEKKYYGSTTNDYFKQTIYHYDNWGKKDIVTDYLGKKLTYTYTKSGNAYTVTETGDDGSSTITTHDALGRQTKTSTKLISNEYSNIDTKYDIYDRKTAQSEPYIGTTPTLWNYTDYDNYGRISKLTPASGNVVNFSYQLYTNGSLVFSTDSYKNDIVIKNALGQIVYKVDEGGVINNTYFANGNLKETNAAGAITSITQDDWGRKTSINETSAGLYSYTYNAFGETLTETTPIGKTTYTLDGNGKLTNKTVVSLGQTPLTTNISSNYTYDPTTKQLTNVDVTNPIDGNSAYTYTYDTITSGIGTMKVRLITEDIPEARFTVFSTYDAFGRENKTTRTAVANNNIGGKSLANKVQHIYKNGFLYKIIDINSTPNVVLWQANATNARGQLTSAVMGNGISITNDYDAYGYPIQNKHDLTTPSGTSNLMTLNNILEPKRGNVTTRTNTLFGTTENFMYDNLDRLVTWDSSSNTFLTCTFDNGSIEGFQSTGSSTTFSNDAGRLKVSMTQINTPIKKLIIANANAGQSFLIKFDIQNQTQVNFDIIEVDPISQNIISTTNVSNSQIWNNNSNQMEYTVSNSSDVYISFNMTFIMGWGFESFNTFYIDNLQAINILATKHQSYLPTGQIDQNCLGQYNYTIPSKTYQNSSIVLPAVGSDPQQYYYAHPNQAITYNAFKNPIQINEAGKEIIDFKYNYLGQRCTMYYGDTNPTATNRKFRRYYSADGSMEIKYDKTNPSAPILEFLIYTGGDAYTAPAVYKGNGNSGNGAYYYLHRDYQGSILAISNNVGALVEKRRFDPWGAVVDIRDGNNNTLPELTFIDRGYTGHEHLEGVGLINMNARLYDPKLHRFLQPDVMVEDPNNLQNYNRYSYCTNNPLKHTDVSGNDFGLSAAIIIAVTVALATYTATAYYKNQPITLNGALQTAVIAAVCATVTFGIGEACGTIGNFYVKAATEAVAHGTFQGGMSAVQGGNFWTGFAAGAAASAASSFWSGGDSITDNGNYTMSRTIHKGLGLSLGMDNVFGMVAFGTVMGGAGAALTGGNFWQGAATGFVVSGLNHVAHQIQIRNEIESKYPRLYKTLSKLKSFVKSNEDVLNSLSETSGYSPKELLKLLSVKNLSSMLTVEEQGDWGHFSKSDPSKISIRASLIRGLEMVKLPENLNATSFFAGETVLHEFVHYGRFWNGLSDMVNIKGTYYEAGEVFETNAFGRIIGLNGNSQIMNSNGWKF